MVMASWNRAFLLAVSLSLASVLSLIGDTFSFLVSTSVVN